jgi:hypothetical protein
MQHFSRGPVTLSNQAQKKVFRTNVVMAQFTRFVSGKLNGLPTCDSETHLAYHLSFSTNYNAFGGATHLRSLDTKPHKSSTGHAILVIYESQQQVLGSNVVLLISLCLFLRKDQDRSCSLCKAVR